MRPETESDVSQIIAGADAPLHIRGGGTRVFGAPPDGAQVLETGAITGVTLYEPSALTLVVKAGTPVAEVEEVLAGENQRLPFEPMDHRGLLGTQGTPTIGGVGAGNVSGPRRVQAGACRDHMLGVRFVDGSGTVLKNGGRVMKNVTGYDLVKLLTGSWGTLGVLTEVSLKVLPRPETAACILINGLDDRAAVTAMSRALGSPYEITGAAHAPKGVDGHPVTMLRIEGFETSVAYRADRLKTLLAETGGEITVERAPERLAAGWAWVRDVALMQGADGDVWRISVKPSDAPALVDRLAPLDALYDWGGGLVWVRMRPGVDARARMGEIAGHATLVRGSDAALPVFHPEPAPVAALAAGLRQKFDPRGLLNPGMMG